MRRLLVLLALLFAAFTGVARADTILAPGDRADLAQQLAVATAQQGVCYGWDVTGGYSDEISDTGSSFNTPASSIYYHKGCSKWVILRATLTYVDDSCDCDDSADVSIDSNLPNPPSPADLDAMGFSSDSLVGDNDDDALYNMVAALPLITARDSQGTIPYVKDTDPAPRNLPSSDVPTDAPAFTDWWRVNENAVVYCAFMILVGSLFLFFSIRRRRRRAAPPSQQAVQSQQRPKRRNKPKGRRRSTPRPSYH